MPREAPSGPPPRGALRGQGGDRQMLHDGDRRRAGVEVRVVCHGERQEPLVRLDEKGRDLLLRLGVLTWFISRIA